MPKANNNIMGMRTHKRIREAMKNKEYEKLQKDIGGELEKKSAHRAAVKAEQEEIEKQQSINSGTYAPEVENSEQDEIDSETSLIEDLDLTTMTVKELQELAEINEIDLGNAIKKADIISAITSAKSKEDVEVLLGEELEKTPTIQGGDNDTE